MTALLASLAAASSFAGSAWHALDAFALFPNAAPRALPSLADFPALAATLPHVLARALEKPELNVMDETCLRRPTAWRLVGVRQDPFTSLVWGDASFLNERAMRDKRFSHECAPTVRLGFQPYCGAKNDRSALDAALHFVVLAGLPAVNANGPGAKHVTRPGSGPKLAQRHAVLHAAARAAIGGPAFLDHERAYLDFCNDMLAPARHRLVESMAAWRAVRLAAHGAPATAGVAGTSSADLEAYERQFSSIASARGSQNETPAGTPLTPLFHPALAAMEDFARDGRHRTGDKTNDRTWRDVPTVLALIQPLLDAARAENILQAGAMTTGFGTMRWSFSHVERGAHALEPASVRVFSTDSAGRPSVLLDLGAHDTVPPDARSETAALSVRAREALARNNPLEDIQRDAKTAWRAAKREQALADPGRSHASTQTCFSCHLAQERATMALRVASGEGPREFGYFFRQLGYIDTQPSLSRRVIAHARRTAWRLNKEFPK